MDNRLKQRLIGAAVLMALAVIIIPELVKKPAGPDKPAVTTSVPPPAGPDTQGRDSGVTISLPSVPAPSVPAPELTDKPAAAPAPGPAENPPQAFPAMPEEKPAPAHLAEEKPASAPPVVVKPAPLVAPVAAPETHKPESRLPARAGEGRKPEASEEAESARSKPLKELLPKSAPPPRAAETAKSEPARPKPVEAAKPAPAAAKPAELAKAEPKPEEPAKPEPARSVELPKIELIGQASTRPASPPPPPAKVANINRSEPIAAPRTSSAAASPAERSGWMIQAGSFALAENANLLRDKLRGRNFSAFVEPVTAGGKTLYRVRIGPQASRAESEAVLGRLQREVGVSGQIVAR